MTMNNQSPLIPQGSLVEQRNKGRARVKIAVFLVLAIHGVGLMALLMQGCKKEPDTGTTTTASEPEATNTMAPAFVEATNAPSTATNLVTAPTFAPTSAPVETAQPVPAPLTTSATDYVIVKGDTFGTVAKKFHVSVKGLLEANPSVEPTKLKIGQTIHVPAAASTSSPASAVTAAADTTGTGQTYTVKSGDSLTKIAGQFGIKVRALRSFNNLKTDKIVVGQKLAIPAKTSVQPAGSPPASAGTSAPAGAPSGQ
jgi:LysM repeat protein